MALNLELRKIENIVIDGIDHKDYPDYCDAFIESADYEGRELTDEELDELNENQMFVHAAVFDQLF